MDLIDRFARSFADRLLMLFCLWFCLFAGLFAVCLLVTFHCVTYYLFTYLNCLCIYLLTRALYLPELSKLVEVEPLPAL